MKTTVVLLSGGLDSTVLVGHLLAEGRDVYPISFDYGQRHLKELEAGRLVCRHYGLYQTIVPMTSVFDRESALLDDSLIIPNTTYGELMKTEKISPMNVPFRNGIFLAVAASIAMSRGYDEVAIASHASDAENWAYPDCSAEFNGGMATAIFLGTGSKIRLLAPFQHMTKSQVVRHGFHLSPRVPYELTWSCYRGEDVPCMTCPTCRERMQAFADNFSADPLLDR